MFNQLLCFGVKCIASLLAIHIASSGSNALYNERLHCANSDKTPAQYEQKYYRAAQNKERFAAEPFFAVGSLEA